MNDDEQNLPADAEFPVEDQAIDEAPDVIDAAPAPAKSNKVAWLAALLSTMALVGVAYMAFETWRSKDDSSTLEQLAKIDALERRVDQSGNAVSTLKSQLEARPDHDYSADIDAVQRGVDEQLRLLDSLPARMSSIENSVASLAGISAGARETFLLAEAEYYLQIANAQLQLANNPQLAILALGMADERVTQMSNPGLIDVRRAISDELAALEVMEKPDLEGASLTLASLARVVESLPLAKVSGTDDNSDTEVDPDQGNIDRAWQSVKGVMSGLVKVTPPEQAKLALLSPDAEYFLRNNVAMQLQAARLALLRGEQQIFEQVLDDSDILLETYFDSDSAQVTGARQTIAEIRQDVYTTARPDISGSLRLLRQFRTLSETTE